MTAVPLAVLEEGSGPPVMLVHGFASTACVNWRDTGWVAAFAAAGFRVIAPDLRGHGASPKFYAPEEYAAPAMVADLLAVLDKQGIAAAHIVGYSMGARLGAVMAATHPARVRSLVIGGLGAHLTRPMGGAGAIARALLAPPGTPSASAAAQTFRTFAERNDGDLPALAACVRAMRTPVSEAALATLALPVLIALGGEDVIAGSGTALAALIPGARLYVAAGRNHMKAVGDRGLIAASVAFVNAAEAAASHPGGATDGLVA